METIDSGKITILTALDMLAAFDTLDHTVSIPHFSTDFSTPSVLSGYIIHWVRSYLTNRTSFVKISTRHPQIPHPTQQYAQAYPRALSSGVTQIERAPELLPGQVLTTGSVTTGSVFGPLLFVLFISLVASVINPDLSNTSNIVSFHQYADDTQLYIGTNLSLLAHQVASIESCTRRVHNWLLNNGLHLNPS